MKCIKDEDGKVRLDEVLIRRIWQIYFHTLLNEERDKGIVRVVWSAQKGGTIMVIVGG